MSREIPNRFADLVAAAKPAAGVVRLGALALRLGLTDRRSLHADGATYESVTDHTVMVGLLACSLAARHQPDLDLGLIAEFASVHDLVEAYAGDTPTLRLPTAATRADKERRERAAFERIAAELGNTLPWVAARIAGYEALTVREARWVKAVDKVAVKVTHILNRCAAPRQEGMTVDELRRRYDAQYDEVFGPGGYDADFPALALVYRELVDQELALFAEATDGTAATLGPAIIARGSDKRLDRGAVPNG